MAAAFGNEILSGVIIYCLMPVSGVHNINMWCTLVMPWHHKNRVEFTGVQVLEQ